MKKLTVFYSWQSDLDRRLCRDFIRAALEEAAATLNADLGRGIEIEIDSDTQGIAGTPPITETILGKIRSCEVFAPDVTFVAETPGGKRLPNPNVMAEYGYALLARGHGRMLPIMNTAFGGPNELPFDMRNLRHPIGYEAPVGISNAARRERRGRLSSDLRRALDLMTTVDKATQTSARMNDDLAARAEALASDRGQRTLAMGAPVLVPGPRVVLHFVPAAAFEADFYLDPRSVRKVSPYFVPPDFSNSTVKAGASVDEWWCADPPKRHPDSLNPESEWCTRLFVDGMFEVSQNIGRRVDDDPHISVRGTMLEDTLVGIVDRLGEAYVELGISGPAWLSVTLFGTEDVELLDRGSRKAGKFRLPWVPLGSVRLAGVGPPLGNSLKPIFDRLWMASGWEQGSPSFGSGDWAGYQHAPYRRANLSL